MAAHDEPTAEAPTRGTIAALRLERGTMFGPYKLLEQLGEGGMGVVYLAEQMTPIHRRVALKIVKAGMETERVIARFEAERQALAMMDHPNVARVLDAGVGPPELGSRPYFVMEHVPGVPITEHCDRNRLSINERLDLFLQVCDAVQHAHQKGIIHRDIKPSNILVAVDEKQNAVPKVIDFGVAKALHQKLTERTLHTEQGQLIGTPEYMSPEQAEMSAQDIDTRSDIYSLGVLLYEQLSGMLPFDSSTLRQQPFGTIQRIIREQDPPKPSTKLSIVQDASMLNARKRRIDPRELQRELRGDLDWIVMKCLEKDRTRRYDSANGLALDIRRHLNHEPVLASPPSTAYRLRKFVRRNRGLAASAAAIAAVLIIATAVSVTFGLMANQQRKLAEAETRRANALLAERDQALAAERTQRERAEAEMRRANALLTERDAALAAERQRADELDQVATFQEERLAGTDAVAMGLALRDGMRDRIESLAVRRGSTPEEIETMLAGYDASVAGADLTGLALETMETQIFQPALTAIDRRFQNQPIVRARLLQALAATMRDLGLLEAAKGPQEAALQIRRRDLGPDHAATLASLNSLDVLLLLRGELDEAERHCRDALASCRRSLGDDHPETLRALGNMGRLLQDKGEFEKAEPFYREALQGLRRVFGDNHHETLVAIINMGSLLHARGDFEGAERHYRQAVETSRRLLGDDHPDTLASLNNMGSLLWGQGELSEAETFYRECLAGRRRALGDRHPETLNSISNMGSLLRALGRPADAEPYYREALEGSLRVLGNGHPDRLTLLNNMGGLMWEEGRLDDAKTYYRQALNGRRRALGDDHPHTLLSMSILGLLEQELGNLEEAEALGAEAVRRGRSVLEPGHWYTAIFLFRHAKALAASARFEEAADEAQEAHAAFARVLGDAHDQTLQAVELLAEIYDGWNAASPGGGHDAQAAAWRAKLPDPPRSDEATADAAESD